MNVCKQAVAFSFSQIMPRNFLAMWLISRIRESKKNVQFIVCDVDLTILAVNT